MKPVQRRPIFPTVRWGDANVTFTTEALNLPLDRVAAVVVFAIHPEGFAVADIPGRGWCVPSGRMEPGETPLETAIRETAEEIGARLIDPREIGSYLFTESSGEAHRVPAFIGRIKELGHLPPVSESRGARILGRAELAAQYWLWDDLLERMFEYAAEVAATWPETR